MAEPAEGGKGTSLRDLAERLVPGGGAQRDRLQAVLDDLVARGELTRGGADQLEAELRSVAGGAGQRLGERASGMLSSVVDQLGLVRDRQLDELELRVAQLEHRLRLVELAADGRPADGPTRAP